MNRPNIQQSHASAIGCSQIAQALGVSPYGTRYELWAHLTGRQSLPDIGGELRVALGEPMEMVLRPFVEQKLGRTLRRDYREYRHETLPWVGHVDYRVKTTWIPRDGVDMKTSLGWGGLHRFGADGTDEVDDPVMLQMQGYMALTGARTWYVAALIPGPELRIYPIQRDPELIDMIEDGIADFWRLVETDTPPDPHDECEARQRWGTHSEGKTLDADEDLIALVRDLSVSQSVRRTMEKSEQDLRDKLIPRLADVDTVLFEGRPLLTYRANKASAKTDWEAVAKALEQHIADPSLTQTLIEANTQTKPGARVLRLKWKGEE